VVLKAGLILVVSEEGEAEACVVMRMPCLKVRGLEVFASILGARLSWEVRMTILRPCSYLRLQRPVISPGVEKIQYEM